MKAQITDTVIGYRGDNEMPLPDTSRQIWHPSDDVVTEKGFGKPQYVNQ